MKFLCPQCKAKYRIADEKLAQRASSRMKCRKCGHVIDIHAATVPDSMFPPAATDDDDDVDEAPRRSIPRMAAAPGALRPAPVPAAKRGAPAPKRPAAAPPRRGVAAAAVAEKTISLDDERAQGAMPLADALETQPATTKPFAPAPAKVDFEDDQPTRIHDGGALSAAFSAVDGSSAAGPQAQQEEWYVGIDGTPVGPIGMAELRERAASGKATLESLVWRDGFEEWKPLKAFPELAGLVAEAARAREGDPLTVRAPSPVEERSAKALSESPSETPEKVGAKPAKSASHPAAWAAIVVALGLGGTIGVVFFSKTEKQEVVKYVEVPASAKADPTPVGGDPIALEESTVSGGTTKKTGGVAPKPEASAPPTTAGKGGLALGGLGKLDGIGPTGNGPDVASPSNAPGGQLDAPAIQRVVANFTSSVRRGCWEPALQARSPDAPSSARVVVNMTISPSGSVDTVSSSGDPKGYPNLSRCIESKVRGWRFPRSSSSTPTQIPFVFAAQ